MQPQHELYPTASITECTFPSLREVSAVWPRALLLCIILSENFSYNPGGRSDTSDFNHTDVMLEQQLGLVVGLSMYTHKHGTEYIILPADFYRPFASLLVCEKFLTTVGQSIPSKIATPQGPEVPFWFISVNRLYCKALCEHYWVVRYDIDRTIVQPNSTTRALAALKCYKNLNFSPILELVTFSTTTTEFNIRSSWHEWKL